MFPDACGLRASHDNRLGPNPLTTADAAGATVITGASATDRVDEAGESFAVEELSLPDAVDSGSLADGPGSSGVDAEDIEDVELDGDDPPPELLPDEPVPAEEEVSARW